MDRKTTDIRMRFGIKLRQCRLQAALTQEELAERAGLHRTYIGGIERGERNVSLVNMLKLARALNLKLSELVTGIDNESAL